MRCGKRTDGRRTVEAPSPGNAAGEDSSKQRTDDTSNTKCRADKALIHRSLGQRHRSDQQTKGAGHDARAPDTSDGSPDDESSGVGRSAAYGGSDCEDDDDDQEHVFGRVEGEDAAGQEQEAAGGKQESAAVPADVPERVELVGYLRDSRGNDRAVLQA